MKTEDVISVNKIIVGKLERDCFIEDERASVRCNDGEVIEALNMSGLGRLTGFKGESVLCLNTNGVFQLLEIAAREK